MSRYSDYLKLQGATEDEIKILVTPTAERAFEAMQTKLDAEAAARQRAEDSTKKHRDWYEQQAVPAYKKMENETIVAKSELARAKAALLTAQERGLLDVAKDLGYTPDAPPSNPNPNPAAIDMSKYVTSDTLLNVAEREGEAIATVIDIAGEHAILFGNDPTKRLNFRELRKEASAKNISVEQLWMDRYGVASARAKREADDRAAYESRLRKEGEDKARAELASQYGSPDARPMVPSRSPFSPRPTEGREKQPWETGDRSNDRVRKATETIVKTFNQPQPAGQV